MTRLARLTAPPAGDPSLHVAGMSVLLRQLFSLQDAGIDVIEIEGTPEAQLPLDSRLTVRLVAVPAPVSEADRADRRRALLQARLGLVWHRLLPKRLLLGGYHGDLEAAQLEPDEFVSPVFDAASARAAEDRLLQSLLKATDGLISRAINRRISLRVTRMVLETPLTPNQMTIIASLFGLAAIAVVVAGGADWLVPGAVLLQIQSILDGCDGEISRLKYIRSRLGEWLDQVLDDLVNVGYFAATGWALSQAGSGIALPVAIAGTGFHILYQISLYTALVTRGGGSGSVASIRWSGQLDPHAPKPELKPNSLIRIVKETIEMAGRRDFFTFLYLPAALLGISLVPLLWCAFIFIGTGLVTSLDWLLRGGPRPAPRSA